MKFTKKLRNEFAGCSSGPVYYESKGHAISAFDAVLESHGLHLDFNAYGGDSGYGSYDVLDEESHCVGYAFLSWYRMPSGRYEFVGYLA